MYILFYHTNQKNVLQKEKDWTFEVYLLVGEPSPLILADWIIENDLCQILCVVPEFFFQRERVSIVFCGLTSYPSSV